MAQLVSTLLQQLPRARNFLEFVQSPLYLSSRFPKLSWDAIRDTMKAMFEICPTCYDETKLPPDVTYSAIVSGLLEKGECLSCSKTRNGLWLEYGHRVQTFNIVNHEYRAMLSMAIAAYMLHLILRDQICADRNNTSNIMFASATNSKATDTIKMFTALLRESPWFMRYNDLLDDVASFANTQLLTQIDTLITYKNVGVNIFATRFSPESIRGNTNWAVFCDNMTKDEILMVQRTLYRMGHYATSHIKDLGKSLPYFPVPIVVYSHV